MRLQLTSVFALAATCVCVATCADLVGANFDVGPRAKGAGGTGARGGAGSSTGQGGIGGNTGTGGLGGSGGTGGTGGTGGIGAAGGAGGDGGVGGVGGQGGFGGGNGGAGGALGPCGLDIDNGNGTCTRVIAATIGVDASGYMQRSENNCPLNNLAIGPFQANPSPTWTVEGYKVAGDHVRRNSYLTFDTSSLSNVTSIVSVEMRVYHQSSVGHNDDVELYGGTQPIFGAQLGAEDYDAGTTLLDSETMNTASAQGFANFAISLSQVNTLGNSQFRLRLKRGCANFNSGNNYWEHHKPGTNEPAKRPALTAIYLP